MPDYHKMYTALFNSVTDAIRILQEAQQQTEEVFVDSGPPQILPLPQPPEGEE